MNDFQVARQFSRYPAGRFLSDGPYSGQAFREKFLLPLLRKSGRLTVILDGAEGYGSSFLEEAFGGLVRIEGMTPSDLRLKLSIQSSEEPLLIDEIWGYIDRAWSEKNS